MYALLELDKVLLNYVIHLGQDQLSLEIHYLALSIRRLEKSWRYDCFN